MLTAWLIRLFVPNRDQVSNPQVRAAYGTLAAVTGIIVNVLLSAAKFLIGILSGSLAITADAVNNLSDAAGSVMTLVSVRFANRPVDHNHPFGHGRMEYIGSLGVGALIVFMGLSLLRDGISAILHPEALEVSWVMMAVLLLSVLGKLWLYFFYRKTGGAVNNGTLLAAAKDSFGDVLATSAVILGTVLNMLLGWQLDGPMGVIVAVIVFKAGIEVCRDTLDSLLGGKPDPEKIQQIRELLLSREGILGLHDLVLHDYGPGRCVASVHAEVSAEDDILTIHEMIDDAEREIGEKMHMPICIHMDPVVTRDETTNRVRQQFGDFLTAFDPALSMHDFRMVPGEGHTNLIFDCVLPAGYTGKEALMKALNAYAHSVDECYRLVVQFDTDYT